MSGGSANDFIVEIEAVEIDDGSIRFPSQPLPSTGICDTVPHILCVTVCSTNVVYCVTTGTAYIAAKVADTHRDGDVVVTVAPNAGGVEVLTSLNTSHPIITTVYPRSQVYCIPGRGGYWTQNTGW